MELALSLGDNIPKPPFPFLDHKMVSSSNSSANRHNELGFCAAGPFMIFNTSTTGRSSQREEAGTRDQKDGVERKGSSDPPVQLDLLPFSPVQCHPPPPQLRFPWLSDNLISKPGKGLQVINRQASVGGAAEEGEDTAAGMMSSSPNSAASSYSHHHHHHHNHSKMDFTSIFRTRGKRDFLESVETGKCNSNSSSAEMILLMENGSERSGGCSSRGGGGGSDEEFDMNGLARKKLRLTKDQSAFLEESFKEHSTLNPKQKIALAKQLNLRPRQVEVWFQNRRARTKLKQTEVDCEYLKRCCETLTEENRRLQKEVQELRALKSSKPFYMQLPATTLTMCPSCERVASTTTTASPTTTINAHVSSTSTAGGGGGGTVGPTANTTLSLARSILDS